MVWNHRTTVKIAHLGWRYSVLYCFIKNNSLKTMLLILPWLDIFSLSCQVCNLILKAEMISYHFHSSFVDDRKGTMTNGVFGTIFIESNGFHVWFWMNFNGIYWVFFGTTSSPGTIIKYMASASNWSNVLPWIIDFSWSSFVVCSIFSFTE